MSGECEKCGEHPVDCVCNIMIVNRGGIRNGITINPEDLISCDRWRSIKEMSPLVGDFCLVHSKIRDVGEFVGYLENDGKWKCYIPTESRSNNVDGVTHWMPLPNPPRK